MSKAQLGKSAEFKYPQNLIYDVLGKTSDAPDIDASVEYILSARLTEREASTLKMRYKDLMTYARSDDTEVKISHDKYLS